MTTYLSTGMFRVAEVTGVERLVKLVVEITGD